eukprot:1152134-Pelagomonas_calceolata.AAC.2
MSGYPCHNILSAHDLNTLAAVAVSIPRAHSVDLQAYGNPTAQLLRTSTTKDVYQWRLRAGNGGTLWGTNVPAARPASDLLDRNQSAQTDAY